MVALRDYEKIINPDLYNYPKTPVAGTWRALPSKTVIETLGSTYHLDPLIFQEMMCIAERNFWRHKSNIKTQSQQQQRNIFQYPLIAQLNQKHLYLSFEAREQNGRENPRLWIACCDANKNQDYKASKLHTKSRFRH
jgi:hypothetical protein